MKPGGILYTSLCQAKGDRPRGIGQGGHFTLAYAKPRLAYARSTGYFTKPGGYFTLAFDRSVSWTRLMIVSFRCCLVQLWISSLFAENNLDLSSHHVSQGVSLLHAATKGPGPLGMYVSPHVHVTISVFVVLSLILHKFNYN